MDGIGRSRLYPPLHEVRRAVARALEEDLGAVGDVTSALVEPAVRATGVIVPRNDGVLAGTLCVDEAFRSVDPTVTIRWAARDGDRVTAGMPVATVEGPLSSILTAERTALNFLCHLSGVATATRTMVDAAAGRLLVLDTRKTIPGLRALQKAAVRAGGGANHRSDLSEAVLVKDNHRAGMSIREAVEAARTRWPTKRVQVECDDESDVEEALRAGADAVLLDNMSPELISRCVERVRDVAGGRCFVEVSGGVTPENVRTFVATGADAISTSVITMSARALDIGLDLERVEKSGSEVDRNGR